MDVGLSRCSSPNARPTTSGTGFFVYGLAWGINHGLLHDKRHRRAVIAAGAR